MRLFLLHTYLLVHSRSIQNQSEPSRPVVPGCAVAHPDFGRSVNPISTGGTDYAHLITAGTPGFSDLPTALYWQFFWEI